MQVAKKCFKDEWEEKRVEFLPVEWRTWLSLDKGTHCRRLLVDYD
jgi:phospholipase DDHD1